MDSSIKYMKKSNFLILIIILLFSCSDKIEQRMLPGKYVSNLENYNDTIEIFTNNKYVHTYKSTNGKSFKGQGIWKYDSIKYEIVFHNFIFYNEKGGDISGFWVPKIKYVGEGKIRLIYSSENGIYYEKVR